MSQSLVFENVSFTYPNANKPSVTGANLSVQAGQNIAIVGPNGSGKTTLVSLLQRLLVASEGRILIDGTDNFETRYLLNDASVATGTPWIYGGAISTYGAWMTMVPDEGPCLRCLYPMPPPPGSIPTCETAGVIGPTPSVIASYQTAEALKIPAGRRDLLLTGYIQVDLMDGRLHRLAVPPSPTCPCCVTRRFDFLEGESASRTHRICGSGGILVLAPRGTRLDLKALEKRYRDVGPVFRTPYLIETEWEGHSVTLYPDGRALIKGTSDPARARALYARFLGV